MLTDILIKLGNQFHPDSEYYKSGWRDGQVVEIRPAGFFTGTKISRNFAVLSVPIEFDLESLRKYTLRKQTKKSRKLKDKEPRLWFVDLEDLRQKNKITHETYADLYTKDKPVKPIFVNIVGVTEIVKPIRFYEAKKHTHQSLVSA